MSKILSKIFGDAGGNVVDKLASVADRFIRTKDEKANFEKEMKRVGVIFSKLTNDYKSIYNVLSNYGIKSLT